MSEFSPAEERFERIRQRLGFFLGLIAFLLLAFMKTPDVFIQFAQAMTGPLQATDQVSELAFGTKITLALTVLMIIWWVTEAIPIPATALLPGVLLPVFHVTGFSDGKPYEFTSQHVFANYAHPVIFLFLGGFLLAAAMQKWGLDKRLTLWILSRGNLANNAKGVVLGMMSVTAFISMWISNTATTAMMLPLGLGILSHSRAQPRKSFYGTGLMLGIAWAASIGGVGTMIGTPPNGIAVSILETAKLAKLSFLDWMKFGVPYVLIVLPVAWLLVIKMFPPEIPQIPGGKELILQKRKELGTWSHGERVTMGVFLFAVVLWISNPFWASFLPQTFLQRISWLDEYTIAMVAALLLFITPVDWKNRTFALDWKDSKFVEWGTLILFGGGIALSDAMFKTGLAHWIATSFVGFVGTPSTFVLVIVIVFLMAMLTEVTSNTAVTSMMVPVVISIAKGAGANPVVLSISAAVAASMAFMLPVATPPNALVYGTGYINIRDMVKVGFLLDMIGWVLTVLIIYVFGHLLFGVFTF